MMLTAHLVITPLSVRLHCEHPLVLGDPLVFILEPAASVSNLQRLEKRLSMNLVRWNPLRESEEMTIVSLHAQILGDRTARK
jgi:hypothetical protein